MNTKKLLKTSAVIQDTPIEQDAYSYAKAHVEMGNIDVAEWELYEKILKTFTPVLPKPSLIVSLEAPISVIAKRISHRARGFEKSVELSYLRRLNRLNTQWIDTCSHSIRVIHIDTTRIDIVSSERDKDTFLQRVNGEIS
jgi:deoxyadenosine/deoxycytidine kinase